MIYYLGCLMTVLSVYALFLSLTNIISMTNLSRKAKNQKENPFISVCIPARNEQNNIETCVRSFLIQEYPNFEVLVLDDMSEDATASIVRTLEQEDPRVHLISGNPLPEGWKGKVHAMQQLFERSKGEYLLFTDADTKHKPLSLRTGIDLLLSNHAKFVSGYPFEETPSIIAGSLEASMIFNTMLYIPIPLQNKIQKSFFSMAIGQYVMLQKSSLSEVGGMATLRNEVCDDVGLARLFAKTGHRQLFCDLKNVVSCKMYNSLHEAFSGTERSLGGVIKQSTGMSILLVFAVIVLFLCSSAPIASIIALAITQARGDAIFLTVASFLFWLDFFIVARFHGFSVSVSLMGPVTFIFVIAMYVHSSYLKATGRGFIWKGRKIM